MIASIRARPVMGAAAPSIATRQRGCSRKKSSTFARRIGSTYGLLALGIVLVYGVSGVVDFSHGDFISLGMFMCLALENASTH